MSVPTLTGMTLINNANTTTNWSGWGNNTGKWGASADIKKQGAASNAMQPNATGDSGWGYTAVGGINLETNRVVIWVFVISPSFVDTMDNKGIYIRICSGSSWTTEYSDYYMGGRDVKWCGRGWHLLVLDANRTRDAGTGTTNKQSIARIGVGFNVTGTASKSDVIAIDAMYYGAGVEVTGPSFTDASNGIDLNDNGGSADTIVRQDAGSFITDGWEVGDYVKVVNATTAANDGVYGPISNVTASTLTIPTGSFSSTENNDLTVLVLASVLPKDIYTKDGPTDDYWWGIIDQGPQGLWVINYKLIIGDVSGSNNIFFYLPTKQLVAADQALDTTVQYYLQSAEDTGETHILFGGSTGTLDNRVGFGGAILIGEATDFDYSGSTSRCQKSPRGVDFDAEITSCEIYGSAFISMDGGLLFAVTGTDHYITNVSFQACGQVDIGGVESRNLTFTGYSGSDGALLWRNSVTDIKNSYFLANTNTSGNASGIEHDTASAGESYIGLRFAGNNYDLHFSASSGNLSINASKGLFASNPSTYWNESSGTVTITNTVQLIVVVKNEAGTVIQNAQTSIYVTATDVELMNKDTNASGIAQEPYNYTVDTPVNIRVRKGESTDNPKYQPIFQPATIESEGLSVTITMYEDPVNNS